MSETTLTQDAIQAIHNREPVTVYMTRELGSEAKTVVITTEERRALCDAAARAETLEAQLTEVTRELTAERHAHNVCSEGQQLIIDKLNQTEAALAPLRAVIEDLRSWLFEQFDVFKSRDSITARAIAASFKDVIVKLDALSALPADPSAPTSR